MAPPSSYPTRSASIAEISATDSMFSTAFHPPVHWTSSSLLKLRVLPVIIRIADWQQMNKDTRRLVTSKRVQSFACAQNFCLRHRSLKAELALATNPVHQKVESCKFHFYLCIEQLEKLFPLFQSEKFMSVRKVLFDCSHGELSNSVRLDHSRVATLING